MKKARKLEIRKQDPTLRENRNQRDGFVVESESRIEENGKEAELRVVKDDGKGMEDKVDV